MHRKTYLWEKENENENQTNFVALQQTDKKDKEKTAHIYKKYRLLVGIPLGTGFSIKSVV